MLVADGAVHEFEHHLRLHLVLEAVAVATHNHLADHLLGTLLAPHTAGTVFINFFARQTLVRPGGESQVN